ncbi:hypothetical protein GQ55_3G217800 [Panicum hallii var. hallii]|uniref:C3H1-type domain-containing protein n=1 Tax=Panicum hallii var. hallii TaxID=1504633 RepID=A0A2T7EC09_9POAL|nr:hypothetical protein GQ55_3G217800 [Panicum hallii var. hallii]
MASAGGGVGATDEIPEVEREVVERAPEEPGRVGSKRVRDSPSALGSHGFYGVTTAKKKPMLQLHNVDKNLSKAGNSNLLHMNSDGASKVGGRYLHGTDGLGTPDSSALRLNILSPGENLENETKWATKICTFYTQGWCKKGNSCAFLHEREGLGFAKAGLLAPPGFENHRGSEEGSQGQHQSNLKVPQFKDAEGSSKHELYRSLIHVYGEDNERLAHIADKRNSTTPGISQGLHGTGSIVQGRVVHEKNHKPFMRHHTGLSPETYLDGRGILLDGGNFQSGMDRRNGLSNAHVARTYLDANTLNSGHQFQSCGLSISSDPFQLSEKLSAYGATTENLPNTHQKEHSSHASYSSRSLTGFRNPGYAIPEISLGSPTLQTTSQLGVQFHHLFTTGTEKVNLHTYIDADKGCGTSRPALLSSSSSEPYIMSAGPLSPIKDEVWETSVPFVPSFSFPDSTTPPGSQYDPFVDYIEPPKVGDTDNLKSSYVSFSTSSQHTNQYVITDESLNRDDELTRNIHAKGANGPAYLIASDRGHSSSLDDNNRVKSCDRKIGAANNDEKARDFRFHLAEHIKELIKPIWKAGNLSKDAHKLVVKKSVGKIVDSIGPNQIPTTEELIAKYITTSGSKIEKLVKAYVDKHRTT